MARYVIKKVWYEPIMDWHWVAYDESGCRITSSTVSAEQCEQDLRTTLANRNKSEIVKEIEL